MTLVVIDCQPSELAATLAALGVGRRDQAVAVGPGTPPTMAFAAVPGAPASGLSVLDSPAPFGEAESDKLRALLSGELTRWDDEGESGDVAA